MIRYVQYKNSKYCTNYLQICTYIHTKLYLNFNLLKWLFLKCSVLIHGNWLKPLGWLWMVNIIFDLMKHESDSECRKWHSWVIRFLKFPQGACPRTPLASFTFSAWNFFYWASWKSNFNVMTKQFLVTNKQDNTL